MIEVTEEILNAALDVWDAEPVSGQRDPELISACIAAALAIVERDRCLKARNHVFHPLDRPDPKDPRVPHSHVCVSCSPDGRQRGPGCLNCRGTGFDQTPCTAAGHRPHCPVGCCDQQASSTASKPSGGGS